MSEMLTRLQVIQRVIPARLGGDGVPLPECPYGERTGRWEAAQDGVRALAETREKAEEFVRFILRQRSSRV